MNCSVLFVPFTEPLVLFDDPDIYLLAALFFGSLICMLEQEIGRAHV